MLWNDIVEIGFAVSLFVNAILFIPQVRIIFRTKTTKDVSLITFVGFNIIQLFTVLHGLITHDYILLFGYVLSLITCGAVSALVIYYRYIKSNASK